MDKKILKNHIFPKISAVKIQKKNVLVENPPTQLWKQLGSWNSTKQLGS